MSVDYEWAKAVLGQLKDCQAEIARLRLAVNEPQWISILDRLPPQDERVLYCAEIDGVFGHEVNAGRWNGKRTLARADGLQACVMDYGDEDGDWEPCTHWMQLPPLPKGEK